MISDASGVDVAGAIVAGRICALVLIMERMGLTKCLAREGGTLTKIEVQIPMGLRSVCDAGDDGEQPAERHQRRIIELANWRATPVPANGHYLVRHDLRWLA